jgi:hypothetical protein
MLSSFSGTDGGEVLDDLYKREAELEGDDRARKGGEEDVDPQGEDDDPMDFVIEMEDKDTQTGNITMEIGTQYVPTGKNISIRQEGMLRRLAATILE